MSKIPTFVYYYLCILTESGNVKTTMKRLILVLASMASIASTFAQDVIVKRDGEEIQCRIMEVSTNKVKYKQWKNQDGPTFVEKKTDILMLKYENGQKEVMTFTAPVGASQIEEPELAETPVDSAALADTMPISNDFLEYARKEKSGILMWGRPLSERQAHTILGKDWTDFSRAHKSERVGRGLIFAGGALIVGGGLFTANYIWASNDYASKKSAYNKHVAEANNKYTAKISDLNNAVSVANTKLVNAKSVMDGAQYVFANSQSNYQEKNDYYTLLKKRKEVYMDVTDKQLAEAYKNMEEAAKSMNDAENAFNDAKTSYNHAAADVTSASEEYQSFIANGTENYNSDFYNASYKKKMEDADSYRKASIAPMVGCYASGAALLVWGIVKEQRAKKKINSIVNRLNAEDAYPGEMQEESRRKPEFDMEGRENGLAFLLKF